MSQKDLDEVTFIDASAYFSEEEWKLLQEWQKELYRNVMKEIHHALMSLGPLIANTVCSIRAKEKEEICLPDSPFSEKKHRMNHSSREGLLRINNEVPLHLKNAQGSEEIGTTDCESSGFPFLDGGICLSKEEPVSIFIDHLGKEIRESGTDPISEHDGGLFRVKEEEEVYSMDHQDSLSIGSFSRTIGNESKKRRKKASESMKFSEKYPLCRAFSVKSNTKVLKGLSKDHSSTSQALLDYYQELEGGKASHCDTDLSSPSHFNLHQGSPAASRSDAFYECENTPGSAEFPKDLNMEENSEMYMLTGWNSSYSLVGEHTKPARSDSRARPYACTECEKSFFEKSHLITHHRTHSGEKPYTCTFCHKSFNRKDNLTGHVRIHTGERPYTCSKCDKNFRRKSDLNLHQKKHDRCKAAKTAILETGPEENETLLKTPETAAFTHSAGFT
ncbi:zinc finger protein 282-like isoform X2 [Ambystoma mexicanum]|uniref:zinc finger protein 282-like isoform X2 n=1 Tax=Ambystoma mexicanum TaxID=8296 RepID=UPI0037E7F8ED